jgi:hypothetical protein
MATSIGTRLIDLEADSLSGWLAAWYDYAEHEDLGDGLPLVPPTADRVEAMIAAARRPADDLVGVLPPRQGAATVQKIAINAVMAGCRPEYVPVVIGAVEAITDPAFKLYLINTTTNSATPFLVINGPDRDRLGVNYQESCFGSAGRANATIGRALRLIQINIAGSLPGKVSKSVFGQPGRYTLCIGEWEERSLWEPLHVSRGYRREQNAVSVFAVTSTLNLTDIWSMNAESYLHGLAKSLDMVGGVSMINSDLSLTIVLNPTWAERIAQEGFSRQSVQQYLWEHSQIPLDRFPDDYVEPLREQENRIRPGNLVPVTDSPDRISIVVAGGSGSLHATVLPGFNQGPLTRPFELPDPD